MAYITNTYLRRDGADGGMIADLQMNKKRIVDLPQPVSGSDVIDKYNLQLNVGLSENTDILPRMTSNTTPSPFVISTTSFDPDIYKSCTDDQFWAFGSSTRININLGVSYEIDKVWMSVEGDKCSITVLDNDYSVIARANNVIGMIVIPFPYSVKTRVINFLLQSTSESRISKIHIVKASLPLSGVLTSHMSSEREACVNTQYLMGILEPTRSTLLTNYINRLMTSNTSPSGYSVTCSDSNEYEGHEFFRISDFNVKTNFWSTPTDNPSSITLQIPDAKRAYLFEVCYATDLPYTDLQFNISASNDNMNWVVVVSNSTMPTVKSTFVCTNANAFSYFKLTLIKTGSVACGVNCFNVIGRELSARGRSLTDVGTPVDAFDATNKQYCDSTFVPTSLLRSFLRSGIYCVCSSAFNILTEASAPSSRRIPLSLNTSFDQSDRVDIDLSDNLITINPTIIGFTHQWECTFICQTVSNVGKTGLIKIDVCNIVDGVYTTLIPDVSLFNGHLTLNTFGRFVLPITSVIHLAFVVSTPQAGHTLHSFDVHFQKRLF